MSRTQIIKTNAVKKQAKSRQLQFRSVFEISLSIKACKQKVFLDIRLFGIASGVCVFCCLLGIIWVAQWFLKMRHNKSNWITYGKSPCDIHFIYYRCKVCFIKTDTLILHICNLYKMGPFLCNRLYFKMKKLSVI